MNSESSKFKPSLKKIQFKKNASKKRGVGIYQQNILY